MTRLVSACPESASSQDVSERIRDASAALDVAMERLRQSLIEADGFGVAQATIRIRILCCNFIDYRLQLQSEKTAVDMT